jgi:hypothetical protein
MRLEEGSITVTGDTATATALRQLEATYADRRPPAPLETIKFNLRKRNGSWVIESIGSN